MEELCAAQQQAARLESELATAAAAEAALRSQLGEKELQLEQVTEECGQLARRLGEQHSAAAEQARELVQTQEVLDVKGQRLEELEADTAVKARRGGSEAGWGV